MSVIQILRSSAGMMEQGFPQGRRGSLLIMVLINVRVTSARYFLVFLLIALLFPSLALAADLNFSNDTTLNLTGVSFSTFTIASGSTATSLTVGTSTFTVTVPSGGTFTVNASADITFSNTGSIATTCGTTSSIAITGPATSVVVTPTNTACSRPRSNAALTTPPPPAPTRVQANATTVSVTLTWVDPVADNFSVVSIFRNQGGAFPISGTVYAEVAKGVRQYRDRDVRSGETYKYLIRARDSSGNSDGNNTEILVTVLTRPQAVVELAEKSQGDKSGEPATIPSEADLGGEKAAEPKKEEVKKEEEKKEEEKKEEEKKEEEKIQEIKKEEIKKEVKAIVTADTAAIAHSAGKNADPVIEQAIRTEEKFVSIIANGEEAHTTAAVGFIAYGTETTEKLGEGERAGVLDSYRKAYGALPATEGEWQDALSIAAGAQPVHENAAAEARAAKLFKKIYKRVPVIDYREGDGTVLRARENTDQEAMAILAYGIRPETRDLAKEQKGIGAFKSIFGEDPKSAEDWDAVRMMAYVTPP